MDTPIVLSHKTAYRVLHAQNRQRVVHRALTLPDDVYGISESGMPAKVIARYVRALLRECGIYTDPGEPIDILVPSPADRTRSAHFRYHVLQSPIDSSLLVHLAPGLFVTGGALNLVQASSWMQPLELLEYGYELCGGYQLNSLATTHYLERWPLTTTWKIERMLDSHPGLKGADASGGSFPSCATIRAHPWKQQRHWRSFCRRTRAVSDTGTSSSTIA